MNRIAVALSLSLTTFFSVPALAQEGGKSDTSLIQPDLLARLNKLENQQVELYHTLQEKKAAGLGTKIAERITISGLLEIEGYYENLEFEGGNSDSSSDFILATAQLSLAAEITEHFTGDISVLFEEDATEPIEVDEATINFEFLRMNGRFGRQYLPFGVFHSHFISDPLTLELGETRETAFLLGYERSLFSLSAFVFNGDADKIGSEEHIRDWGAALTIAPAGQILLGASYISDLADTGAGLVSEYRSRTAGWSAFSIFEWKRFDFTTEVLGAVDSFDSADFDEDGDGKGDRPLAWNIETAFSPRDDIELALRVEGSRDFFGFPELQYGADVSWSIVDNLTLSLEYLRGEFDADFAETDEAGNPIERRDLVTAQLALEF